MSNHQVVWEHQYQFHHSCAMKFLYSGNLLVVKTDGGALGWGFDSPTDASLLFQPITRNIELNFSCQLFCLLETTTSVATIFLCWCIMLWCSRSFGCGMANDDNGNRSYRPKIDIRCDRTQQFKWWSFGIQIPGTMILMSTLSTPSFKDSKEQ